MRERRTERALGPGENPRFLALYRSPIAAKLSVPVEFAVGVPMVTLILYWTATMFLPPIADMMFAGAIGFGVLAWAKHRTSRDPAFVRVMLIWTKTRLGARNKRRWGGASWSPVRSTPPTSASQIEAR